MGAGAVAWTAGKERTIWRMSKRLKLKILVAASFAAASVGMCASQSNTERCYLATGGVKICGDQAFPQPCQFSADSTGNSFTFIADVKQHVFELPKVDAMVLYDFYGKLASQVQTHPCSWKCLKASQSVIDLIVAELKRRHEDGWIADKPNHLAPFHCVADNFYWKHVDPEGNFHP